MHEGGVGDGAGLRIGRRGGPPVTRLLSLRKVGLGMCCRRHAVTFLDDGHKYIGGVDWHMR